MIILTSLGRFLASLVTAVTYQLALPMTTTVNENDATVAIGVTSTDVNSVAPSGTASKYILRDLCN